MTQIALTMPSAWVIVLTIPSAYWVVDRPPTHPAHGWSVNFCSPITLSYQTDDIVMYAAENRHIVLFGKYEEPLPSCFLFARRDAVHASPSQKHRARGGSEIYNIRVSHYSFLFLPFQHFLHGINKASFWSSACLVAIQSLCLAPPVRVLMEYAELGPLSQYLQQSDQRPKVLHLVMVAEQLAQALSYLVCASHSAQALSLLVCDTSLRAHCLSVHHNFLAAASV